jgi:acetyl-CoA carboxylase biotin carboxyl carrier protein
VSLTAKDVAEITKLLDESDFDELHLELDGMKLSLRRAGAAGGVDEPAPSRGRSAPVADGAAATPVPAPLPVQDPTHVSVTSPLLGTFYRAPRPGAAPFVEVGSEVEPDTVVCIVEVMKLMNTVRAGVKGRVAQILARDGALVEYGETLLRVSRPDQP